MPAKSAAKPAAKTKAPAIKPATKKATVKSDIVEPVSIQTGDPRPLRPLGERADLIAQAAYYRAEQRGFAGNDTLGDWVAAEQDVDAAWRFE